MARIERVRAERERRKAERAAERERRQGEYATWKQTTLPFLGRGVSAGLRYEGGDPTRLHSMGLPILNTASDVAGAIGIEERTLAWLTYHRGAALQDHYTRFEIPKRRGGVRVISSPKKQLRVAQSWLLENVLAKIEPHGAAMAFRPGRSIRDNAIPHLGKAVVVRIDLKDFFPSIGFRRVKGLFEAFGYNEGVSTLFALLATEAPRVALTLDGQKRFVTIADRQLPQGACTSPAVTNVLCRTLDKRLAGATAQFGYSYTRYADDLVFSHTEYGSHLGMLLSLVRIILTDEGFVINDEKTRIMRPQNRQAVTGIVVNAFSVPSRPDPDNRAPQTLNVQELTRVSREDIRRFRAFLHQCETQGFQTVSERIGKNAQSYAKGYLAYLHMVNPAQAAKFRAAHSWLNG